MCNSATFRSKKQEKNIKTLYFNIFIDVINRFGFNIFFFIPPVKVGFLFKKKINLNLDLTDKSCIIATKNTLAYIQQKFCNS